MPLRPGMALAAVLAVSACAQSFDSLARQASEARERGSLDDAAALYKRAVALRPGWSEGWWRLGTIHYDKDRFRDAAAAFAGFVKAEPKAGPGFAMLGLCEFQLGHYETALAALDRGRALGLGSNPALLRTSAYHAALLNTRLGRPEAALAILDQLAAETASRGASTDPLLEAFGLAGLRRPLLPSEIPAEKRDVVRLAGRARLWLALQNRPEALKYFAQLIADWPAEPGVHYLYGFVLLFDDSAGAIKEFERELDVDPRNDAARLQIALECLRTGDYERGLPQAREAAGLASANFAAHLVLGRLLVALDRVESALPSLETAVKLAPDSPDARLALARAYARAGRQAQAERERAEYRRLQALRQGSGATSLQQGR